LRTSGGTKQITKGENTRRATSADVERVGFVPTMEIRHLLLREA
jgi:hypothetical protein